jgi:hypothetical protein
VPPRVSLSPRAEPHAAAERSRNANMKSQRAFYSIVCGGIQRLRHREHCVIDSPNRQRFAATRRRYPFANRRGRGCCGWMAAS